MSTVSTTTLISSLDRSQTLARRAGWAMLALSLACCDGCTEPPRGPDGRVDPSSPEHAGVDGAPDERLLVAPPLAACDPGAPWPDKLRIATWNMHAGRSARLSGIAAELAAIDADVVLLQEVDVGVRRSGGLDQPRVLAEQLGYAHTFAEAIPWDGGRYGLATLSRLPFVTVNRISLDADGAEERRIGLDTTLCHGPTRIRVVNVHADVVARASEQNTRDLLKALEGSVGSGLLLGGDFNAVPGGPGPQAALAAGLEDIVAPRDSSPTLGDSRYDFIFADARVAAKVLSARVIATDRSDHLPVVVDLDGDLGGRR